MRVGRNALTGFRTGWQRPKAVVSTLNINSDTEPAQVDRFDYAADDSQDDIKEASQATSTMSITKPTKYKNIKVCSTESYFNQ